MKEEDGFLGGELGESERERLTLSSRPEMTGSGRQHLEPVSPWRNFPGKVF